MRRSEPKTSRKPKGLSEPHILKKSFDESETWITENTKPSV